MPAPLSTSEPYPRDLVGYGRSVPHARWPGGARIAVQVVVNYEEGGENAVLHGDPASEVFLGETVGAQPRVGRRDLAMESVYEYGARAGFWRLWRCFSQRGWPVTVFGVGMAMARNPDAVAAMGEVGWEIASHGWRWIDYQQVDRETERRHMADAIDTQRRLTGERPLGWYTGRLSPHTRELVMEEGGFLYDSDSYADELPYWIAGPRGPHLVVPYTLDANDMRFATLAGWGGAEDFARYLIDSFDMLYDEGAEMPKLMSVGLHCRLVGRPGRMRALERFLDHVARHDRVWLCRRVDIARHWHAHHRPAPTA
jgi:putative urate catabolism protein